MNLYNIMLYVFYNYTVSTNPSYLWSRYNYNFKGLQMSVWIHGSGARPPPKTNLWAPMLVPIGPVQIRPKLSRLRKEIPRSQIK